jgi:hypothetical protein
MADQGIRADTPDPTKYFPNRGIPGTMIPRAGKEGESLGFDHNKPQKVVVDPGEAGGGFELDLSEIAKHKSTFNAAASKSAVVNDVSSFYREFSRRLTQPEPVVAKEKIVSESNKPNPEKLIPLQPLPAIPMLEQPQVLEVDRLLAEQAKKAAELKAQYFTPPVAPPQPAWEPSAYADPRNNPMQQQLVQQTNLINALIERVNQLSTPVVEKAPVLEEAPKVNEFASLQIPFLSGEKAVRPEYETYFEMTKMGTMAARYHAVVAGQSCLALVYDTRFVDGFQYLPPNLGEERIVVSVPKLKQTYTCSSLGLHWSLGCLDVVILILHKGDDS